MNLQNDRLLKCGWMLHGRKVQSHQLCVQHILSLTMKMEILENKHQKRYATYTVSIHTQVVCAKLCHLPHFFVPLRHWRRICISLVLTYDLVMHDQVIHSLLHPFAFMNFVFATNVHSPFMGTNCVHPPVMLY
jgi:hypothetical protein